MNVTYSTITTKKVIANSLIGEKAKEHKSLESV